MRAVSVYCFLLDEQFYQIIMIVACFTAYCGVLSRILVETSEHISIYWRSSYIAM